MLNWRIIMISGDREAFHCTHWWGLYREVFCKEIQLAKAGTPHVLVIVGNSYKRSSSYWCSTGCTIKLSLKVTHWCPLATANVTVLESHFPEKSVAHRSVKNFRLSVTIVSRLKCQFSLVEKVFEILCKVWRRKVKIKVQIYHDHFTPALNYGALVVAGVGLVDSWFHGEGHKWRLGP